MSLCPRCENKVVGQCKDCHIVLNDYCPFCDYETLKRRTFYVDKDNIWIGFLAAPYHTEGHSIIAPIDKKATKYNIGSCKFKNEKFKYDDLKGMEKAFYVVSRSLMEYHKNRNSEKGQIINILCVLCCGDEGHFHFHIIPRWSNDEKRWRESSKIFEKGYLMSFLGFLELEGDENAKIERAINGWCQTKQRFEIIRRFEANKTIKNLRQKAEEIKKLLLLKLPTHKI
jgi:diadenosine tetraphosphate (Ap4A) HIT family hydrolase